MKPDFDRLAEFYKTTARTIYRWHALGVDVQDPLAVARHLASLQRVKPETLEAAEERLTELLETV